MTMSNGLIGWHALILLVLIGVPIAAAVLIFRRARRSGEKGDAAPVVNVTLVVAAFYGGLCLIGGIVGFVSTLVTPAVTLEVPVSEYWPFETTAFDNLPATVLAGGFTSAELTIEGLATPARLLWAFGQLLGLLVPAAVSGLIALVCFQLLRGAAFAPVVARAAMITAVVVLVGGLGSQVLSSIGGSIAGTQAFSFGSTAVAGFSIGLDFWPIGAGLAFAALAAVFRYGSQLQRDTDGLV